MNLNRNFAAGEFNVDQQAIERAKQVNQSAMMWGSILQGLGMVTGAYGAGTAASAAAAKEAAKTAAINSAAQSSIGGFTAGRYGLQTAAQAAVPASAAAAPAAFSTGVGATGQISNVSGISGNAWSGIGSSAYQGRQAFPFTSWTPQNSLGSANMGIWDPKQYPEFLR